jgi:hypothetical protein
MIRPLPRSTTQAPRKKSKLTARPQYEAYALVIYFDFAFFAFFFFAAMVLFLGVSVEPVGRVEFKLCGRCLVPGP